MSSFAFFCIPAEGHTNPTLGVVRELVARGHCVRYYSYECMRERLEAAGAEFVPCDRWDPQLQLSPEDGARLGKDLAFSTELIVQLTLALDDAIISELQHDRPDCIVGDSMAFWAKLIARKLDIPFVSSTTTFAFNRYSARVLPRGGGSLLGMLLALPRINRSLNRLRSKGYEVKSVLDIIANDESTDTIVYTSPELQPCSKTFGPHYSFVGPIVRPAKEVYRRDGRPLIYMSTGSVDNDRPDIYRHCMEALSEMEVRVIMSIGRGTDPARFGPVPANITLMNWVDQPAILSIADAFITHCGMNSVSEALWNGVPLILYPVTPEQRGVANRVAALNAGILPKDDSVASIRTSCEQILNEAIYRDAARQLRDGMHRCGGADAAADRLERCAAGSARP